MTVDMASLVSDNLDIWTTAVERKSGAGRGGGKRVNMYGLDRLRALILDLAIQGRLVPQDHNEEPAAALIDRIPSDWSAAKRRHRSRSSAIDQPAEPTKIPGGWCAVAGNVIFRTRSGNSKLIKGTLYSEDGPNRFPGFSASGQDVWLDDYEHVGVAIILSAVGARCGKAFLTRGKWSAVANTHIIWLLETVTQPDFAMLVLNNEKFWDRAGGAQPFVKVGNTLDRDFFLPPLAEQRRIVAKVDELMALCNALETESAAALAAHQALVEAVLATLTASIDAAGLATNWARLEAQFDTLFTTESSVDALKRTFLDLAVRGKLVEQDAGDEPAQTAFDRIITLKKNLISQKKTRKDKPSAVIDELDLPFPLPTGWIWCRIGEVALSTEYGTSRKASSGLDGIAILAMGNIQNGAVNLESDKTIPRDSDEFPELLLRYGDILYNRTNSYELVGKTGIFRHQTPDYSFASYLIRIRLDKTSLEPEFLNIAMNTPYFRQTQVVPKITKQTGQANVSGGAMRNMLVPFPPVAEQQRIVVKVGELMALCDELKVRLADAGKTQKHLADAIVERAAV